MLCLTVVLAERGATRPVINLGAEFGDAPLTSHLTKGVISQGDWKHLCLRAKRSFVK